MEVEINKLTTGYGSKVVHENIDFILEKGEFCSVLGGSGSGKTTLLRTIVGLIPPLRGEVKLFGLDLYKLSDVDRSQVLRKCSVLFQEGALFSGMSVIDNVAFPLIEFCKFSRKAARDVSFFWLERVGLDSEVAELFPSELSGGMKKRAALARALILEPDLVFLDEPTSGLDPIAARKFDELLKTLHRELQFTVFMISHDVLSITNLSTNLLVLGEGRVIANGSVSEVLGLKDKWISEYFQSGGVYP